MDGGVGIVTDDAAGTAKDTMTGDIGRNPRSRTGRTIEAAGPGRPPSSVVPGGNRTPDIRHGHHETSSSIAAAGIPFVRCNSPT